MNLFVCFVFKKVLLAINLGFNFYSVDYLIFNNNNKFIVVVRASLNRRLRFHNLLNIRFFLLSINEFDGSRFDFDFDFFWVAWNGDAMFAILRQRHRLLTTSIEHVASVHNNNISHSFHSFIDCRLLVHCNRMHVRRVSCSLALFAIVVVVVVDR